jgi:hypothetical protein
MGEIDWSAAQSRNALSIVPALGLGCQEEGSLCKPIYSSAARQEGGKRREKEGVELSGQRKCLAAAPRSKQINELPRTMMEICQLQRPSCCAKGSLQKRDLCQDRRINRAGWAMVFHHPFLPLFSALRSGHDTPFSWTSLLAAPLSHSHTLTLSHSFSPPLLLSHHSHHSHSHSHTRTHTLLAFPSLSLPQRKSTRGSSFVIPSRHGLHR